MVPLYIGNIFLSTFLILFYVKVCMCVGHAQNCILHLPFNFTNDDDFTKDNILQQIYTNISVKCGLIFVFHSFYIVALNLIFVHVLLKIFFRFFTLKQQSTDLP